MRRNGKFTRQLEALTQNVYEQLLESDQKWHIAGDYRLLTYEDIELLLKELVTQVQKSQDSISIEIGPLLVKRVDSVIAVYVRSGSINE